MPKKFKSAATVDASDLENDVFHSKRSASPQPPPKKRKAPTPPAKPSKRAKIDPKPKEPSDSSESRSENESSNEQGVRSESEEESKISDSESAQSSEGSEEAEPAKFAPQQSSQKDVDTHRYSRLSSRIQLQLTSQDRLLPRSNLLPFRRKHRLPMLLRLASSQ